MRREQFKSEASPDSTVQPITVMYCEPSRYCTSATIKKVKMKKLDGKTRQDQTRTAIVNIIILCVGSNHVKLYNNNIIAMIHVKAW